MNIDKYYSDIISEIQYAGIYEQWCVLDRDKVVAKQKKYDTNFLYEHLNF